MTVIIYGCENKKAVTVSDLTIRSSITLISSLKEVSGLSLHITGQINGRAHLFASNWDKKELSGTVDMAIYHDWFEPTCLLQYEPVSVTSGSLKIEYTFHG
jgi:hypothetical protein